MVKNLCFIVRLAIYKLFSCFPNIPRGLSCRQTQRKCSLLLSVSHLVSTPFFGSRLRRQNFNRAPRQPASYAGYSLMRTPRYINRNMNHEPLWVVTHTACQRPVKMSQCNFFFFLKKPTCANIVEIAKGGGRRFYCVKNFLIPCIMPFQKVMAQSWLLLTSYHNLSCTKNEYQFQYR